MLNIELGRPSFPVLLSQYTPNSHSKIPVFSKISLSLSLYIYIYIYIYIWGVRGGFGSSGSETCCKPNSRNKILVSSDPTLGKS